tara:strand:+ start:3367 stop:3561 length:195 start_codon:yes stop_codon:yes gene_type:complete
MEKSLNIDTALFAVIISSVLRSTSDGIIGKTVLDVVALIVMKDLVLTVLSGGLNNDRKKTRKIL